MQNTLTLQIKLPNAATWGTLETASYDDAIKGMTLKAVTKTMQSRLVGWQGNYAQFRDAQFRIVDSAKPVAAVAPVRLVSSRPELAMGYQPGSAPQGDVYAHVVRELHLGRAIAAELPAA